MTELDLTEAIEAALAIGRTWDGDQDEMIEVAIRAAAPIIERAVRESIATEIERELVCCDEYAKAKAAGGGSPKHEICFWGAASADIARGRDEVP